MTSPTRKAGIEVNIIGTRHKNTPAKDLGSRYKKVVIKVVNLALALLVTDASTDALQDLLRLIVADWNHFSIGHCFPANMDYRDHTTRQNIVGHFIQQLRASHPDIWIAENDEMEGKDAKTRHHRWFPDRTSIMVFDPSRSYKVFVNRLVRITSNRKDTHHHIPITNSL